MREETMRDGIIRWAFYLLALLVLGPLAGSLMAGLRAPDGSFDATPLASTSPVFGAMAATACLVLAGVFGAMASRLVGWKAGMTAAGLILAWADWRTGTVDAMLRSARSASPLWMMALESAIFALPAAAVVGVIVAADRHGRPADSERFEHAWPERVWGGPSAMIAVVAAVVVGGAAAWLVAREPLKGQALAAAIVAGIAGGAAGALIDPRVAATPMALGVALLGVLGPIVGAMLAGSAGVVRALNGGSLFALANPVPMDWLTGAFLGVPIGIGWAGSMLERQKEPAKAAR